MERDTSACVPMCATFPKFCPCPKNYDKRPMGLVFENLKNAHFFKVVREYCPPIDDQFVFCQLFGNPSNCSDRFSQVMSDIGENLEAFLVLQKLAG
uniref:Uncharacterized protein n=1 Tax=Romanomermis culicivorax TaxID=13658 RepID=A0A915K5E5_ROMCU